MSIGAINSSVSLAAAATNSAAHDPQTQLLRSLAGTGGDQDIAGENDQDGDDAAKTAAAASTGAGATTPYRGNKVNTAA